jgi:hypothetical protein
MPVIAYLPAAAGRFWRLIDNGAAATGKVLAGTGLRYFVFISLQNVKKRIILQFY